MQEVNTQQLPVVPLHPVGNVCDSVWWNQPQEAWPPSYVFDVAAWEDHILWIDQPWMHHLALGVPCPKLQCDLMKSISSYLCANYDTSLQWSCYSLFRFMNEFPQFLVNQIDSMFREFIWELAVRFRKQDVFSSSDMYWTNHVGNIVPWLLVWIDFTESFRDFSLKFIPQHRHFQVLCCQQKQVARKLLSWLEVGR